MMSSTPAGPCEVANYCTFLWGPKRPHKHKDLIFWFQGPISGIYQKPCCLGSLCLYTIHHVQYTIYHIYYILYAILNMYHTGIVLLLDLYNIIPYPEGLGTQYMRSQVPNTIEGMVFGTRSLKFWVLADPLGYFRWSFGALCLQMP